MKLNVQELALLTSSINESTSKAYEKGLQDEKEREKPKTLFESMLKYATESKTLVDYCHSKDFKWIQIKPTREGSEVVDNVEIGFDECGMNMHVVSINKSES